jgi:predicted CoA-substrate-specific enzyme activase
MVREYTEDHLRQTGSILVSEISPQHTCEEGAHLFAGVDIGSTTAKTVVVSGDTILGSDIRPTGTNPTKAGEASLRAALSQVGRNEEKLRFTVATGYGRVLAPFANETVTEITCHARGARHVEPQVRTIVDFGGQDVKAISLDDNGQISDFVINDKCAAGTGRFLEFTSKLVLEVPLEEMGPLSLKASKPVKISSACTVFAQTEIISLLASGERKEDILAGLHRAIALRAGSLAKHVGARPVIMMTGGVSKNIGVKKALEEELKERIVVPAEIDPQLIGALGAALIARSRATMRGRDG